MNMDEIGTKRFHWILTTIASMGVFLDGYDLSVISFSIIPISLTFNFSPSTNPFLYGLILSSALIGMAIGGVTFGYLADRIGRKTMFIIDMIFFVVFAALSAFSQNIMEIIIFRMLMGVGIGADYPISSSLIAEYAPSKSRGKLLMYSIMFYWIGTFFAGIVNYFSLFAGIENSWRYAFLFGAIIALPIIFLRDLMPESIRWLVVKGKREMAEKIGKEKLNIDRIPEQKKYSIGDLFRNYLKYTLFVLIVWFGFDVGSYGLGFYTPTLYSLYGIKNLYEIALFTAITAPFPIISYIILMYLVDRWGRKWPTIFGFAVMASIFIILPFLIKINPYYLLPMFIIFASMEQWPGGILSFAYSVELFPTSIRGIAQGLATTVSRIGAIIGVLLFPVIQKSLGLFYGSLFFLSFILLSLFLTLFLAPETSSLSLEDVSEKLSSEKHIH